MLLIHCPYCQEDRSELEFRGSGDAHIDRPQNIAEISDEEFSEFFYMRDNPKGLIFERWRHVSGCGKFFRAIRHTVSDKFVMTYRQDEPKPDQSTIDARLAGNGGQK
jgi:sarcosine oxidase subunit delta